MVAKWKSHIGLYFTLFGEIKSMKIVRILSNGLARFLISAVFISSGVNKILHFRETETYFLNTMAEWQSNIGFSDWIQSSLAFMIAWAPVMIMIAIALLLAGGFSILLGFKEKLGASLLIIFLVPTTILFHQFWFVDGSLRELQIQHFLKNCAILGGLIMMLLNQSYYEESEYIE
jgi:putative oxidoreductase